MVGARHRGELVFLVKRAFKFMFLAKVGTTKTAQEAGKAAVRCLGPVKKVVHTVTGGSTTSYTITGLSAGVAYTVRVIATRGAQDGPPSEEVMGTPTAPQSPPPSDGGGGCTIASEGLNGNTFKGTAFNLLLIMYVPLAVFWGSSSDARRT